MKIRLREQKQEVVRDALYNAAIDLFAAKGFDETTVEDVAQAAGVSRRTFFRYFDSKDDLLSYPVVNYASILAEAVRTCPASYSPLQVTEETVLAGVKYTAGVEARTRRVVAISMHSAAARQAYQSRMMEVEDSLARAYATRFHDGSPYDLRPRLLSAMTLTVMNVSIVSWFQGQYPELEKAATDVFRKMRSILDDAPLNAVRPTTVRTKKGLRTNQRRTLTSRPPGRSR